LIGFRLEFGRDGFQAAAMPDRLTPDHASEGPVTWDRVMQTAIAQGLRGHYGVRKHIPHELFVLLMQMNDKTPVDEFNRRSPSKSRRRSGPVATPANELPSLDQAPELLSEIPI
jgi:hypothetical protein